MITVSGSQSYVADERIHRFALCIKIVRRDGTMLRFTDHNTKLTLNSEVYTPVGSMSVSATQKSDSFRGQNIDYVGVINSAAISSDALREGRYRGAVVYEYIVDWRYPWLGPIRSTKYFLSDVKFNGESWEGTLGGLTLFLESPFGEYYTRNCRYDLGDSGCKINLASLTANNVGVLSVASSRSAFTASDGLFTGKALNYWQFGTIQWTVGGNVGFYSEVYSSTAASGSSINFVLFDDVPVDIQIGDQFTLTPGCDKTAATCKTKFSNMVNYGGFHFIPGLDASLQSPQ